MNRKAKHLTIIYLLAGLLIVGLIVMSGCLEINVLSKRQSNNQTGTTMTSSDTEQKLCPVSGKPINKEYSTEYKGKKVYFCCPACKPEFEKNPEKYIDKLPQFKEK